jgi:hypothetical protein
MIIPHRPYVFDRYGNFPSKEEVDKRGKKKSYIEQLIFANKKIEVLINKLLSKSESPPIIILQADEGVYPQREIEGWKQATKAELRQKMRILNAYYLPHTDKNVLYPSITPVNSFRLIFNLYFDTDFELLPDESYIFVDQHHIYKFSNVTDIVGYN